ncbi:WYL domain-containing protein [Cutibacterium equinum]|uniref:WYL domain-containing protein n=1 Tax=Cutibacterium equinum TaxID=3016342 RepID=A0ABY7R1F8_9ACTN|nr:WYL domain-containing protein [Cutibacterium equinum]WCC81097.1 WYL domain-containing protein [Cutibacterium equinum]
MLIDPTGWFTPAPTRDLSSLLAAARQNRCLVVTYRHSGHASATTYRVAPYGLVSKQAAWYLVGEVDGIPRMFNTNRLEEYEVLDAPAVLQTGESLSHVWGQLVAEFTTRADVEIHAVLRANRLDLAARILGCRLVDVSEPVDGWLTITVAYPDIESVRQLLQFGDHIRVLDPPQAVQRVHDLAHKLMEAHSPAESMKVSSQGSP